jgi:secondary thiamine-phosphate synthase enzyme
MSTGWSIPALGEDGMKTETMSLDTSGSRFVDLTRDVQRFGSDAGLSGLLNVFVPHATAGIALMETGSGSEQDLEGVLERLLPRDNRYAHAHGSVGHGADHLLPVFLSPSVTIPVADGHVVLGTWQSVVLVDTNRDNPHRKVQFTFIEG